jgi:hypothetical protein
MGVLKMSIYDDLKNAGIELASHESDLYAMVTPESTAIVNKYYPNRPTVCVSTFINNIDHKLWYDIPFMYEPFWTNKRFK